MAEVVNLLEEADKAILKNLEEAPQRAYAYGRLVGYRSVADFLKERLDSALTDKTEAENG